MVECGDSDRHSASDIQLFEDPFNAGGKGTFIDENYSGAKLVVAHITDVERLVQKRSLSSSRSFEEPPASRGLTAKGRLLKQQSEVIPDYSYYDSDYHYRASTPKQQLIKQERISPGEVVRRRFLYSEGYTSESSYQDVSDSDQKYSAVFPEEPQQPNTFLTSPTTTITSSSVPAEVQLASSDFGVGSSLRQTGLEMTVAQVSLKKKKQPLLPRNPSHL